MKGDDLPWYFFIMLRHPAFFWICVNLHLLDFFLPNPVSTTLYCTEVAGSCSRKKKQTLIHDRYVQNKHVVMLVTTVIWADLHEYVHVDWRAAREHVFHCMKKHWWHFHAYYNKFLESFNIPAKCKVFSNPN